MQNLFLKLAVAYVATALVAGIGGAASAAAPTPATASAAPVLEGPFFYKFPLSGFNQTVKTDANGREFSAETFKMTTGNGAGHWLLLARSRYSDFSSGRYYIDLQTGAVERYWIHSHGEDDVKAPAAGGYAPDYLEILSEMADMLASADAPAEAVNYVKQIVAQVTAEFPYAAKYVTEVDAKTVWIELKTPTKVDVLVDMFNSPSGHPDGITSANWVTKGRITVEAGTTSIRLPLEKAIDSNDRICSVIKLLPVGGDYTQPLANSVHCIFGSDN